jgi:ATP-dependent DNA helicase RecG
VPIVTVDLRETEIQAVLATQEDHFADLKAIEVAPAKLTRTLAAYANAEGGELFIGIDEDRKLGKRTWRGFSNEEAANGHVQAFEATFPLGGFAEYMFLRDPTGVAPGLVLKASIQKAPDVKTASDGNVYVRRSAQNLPVSGEALRRLEYAKGIRSFETHPLDVPLDFVTNSEAIIEFMLAVVPSGEPEPWLRKQLLIRDDKPTVAAALLFADEPQAALPKATVKVYRYATTEPVGNRAALRGDPLTIDGSAYDVIHRAVGQTAGTVEEIRVMGPSGLEPVSYPQVTLHEIITNAVLHRDYSIADDIHVRIFDNRVEIQSPGRLPAHITPANILDERLSRNGLIVRWISKFPDPPNKDVGEGLRTAFDAMRTLQLKPPLIEDTGTAVLVTIRHERLASPEQMIVEYLDHNDEISNSVVRQLTGIGSENKVKGIFQRMMKAGELERIPNRPLVKSAYRLPGAKTRGDNRESE